MAESPVFYLQCHDTLIEQDDGFVSITRGPYYIGRMAWEEGVEMVGRKIPVPMKLYHEK